MVTKITTYRDLQNYLNTLTEDQLNQKISVSSMQLSGDAPVEFCPVLCIGTCDDMEFYSARSHVNNKYNPDEIVILMDINPFGEDGAVMYSLDENLDYTPIYGEAGPTDPKDQLNPKLIPQDKFTENSETDIPELKNQVETFKNQVEFMFKHDPTLKD